MAKCNSGLGANPGEVRSQGTTAEEMGVDESVFKKGMSKWANWMKAANPRKRWGEGMSGHDVNYSTVDAGATNFGLTGNIDDWAKHINNIVRVNDLFIENVTNLQAVNKFIFKLSGRNSALAAMGGGKVGNFLEKTILWGNRKATAAKKQWQQTKEAELIAILDKHEATKEDVKNIMEWLKEPVPPKKHAALTEDVRGWLEGIRDDVNKVRVAQGRDIIEFYEKRERVEVGVDKHGNPIYENVVVERYAPHIGVSEETTYLGKFLEKLKPNKPAESTPDAGIEGLTNQFALPRDDKVRNYETDFSKIFSRYLDSMGRDAFDSEVLRSNRAHIDFIRARADATVGTNEQMSKKYTNAADILEEYTDIVYGERKPVVTELVDNMAEVVPGVGAARDAAVSVLHQLQAAVFPFNWAWSLFIQTQSMLLIPVRHGPAVTYRGVKKHFFDKGFREKTASGFALRTKGERSGQMSSGGIMGQESVAHDARLRRRGILANTIESMKGGAVVSFGDKAMSFGTLLSETIETNLSIAAAAAAEESFESEMAKVAADPDYSSHIEFPTIGAVGYDKKIEALKEAYRDATIMRTQSMYNFDDRAGFLQNKEVNALIPFQSFAFEMFNTVHEIAGDSKISVGLATGHTKMFDGNSKIGEKEVNRRALTLASFFGLMTASNLITGEVDDREPWSPMTFVPFGSVLLAGGTGRYGSMMMPTQYVKEFHDATTSYIKYGDLRSYRDFFMRYHMVGGSQFNRIVTGLEANLNDGIVEDATGRKMFEIDPGFDRYWAVLRGPWSTEAGTEYWEKRERKGVLGILKESKGRIGYKQKD